MAHESSQGRPFAALPPGARRINRRHALAGALGYVGVAVLVTADRSVADRQPRRTLVDYANDPSTDATAALNAAIAGTPDGSTLRLPSGAKFRVDGTLRVKDRHSLVIDGNGALLYSTVTSPLSTKPVIPMFDILGGSDLTLRSLRLAGTNTTPRFVVQREWQPFIDVHGTQGLLITQIRAQGAWGDFVHITPDTRPEVDVMARGITVRECHAATTGRNQISFTGCQDVLVESCVFDGTGFQVFDIEVQAEWWNARRLTIRNNVIAGRVSLSVLVNAGLGTDVRDISFTGNVMRSLPVTCQPPVLIVRSATRRVGWTIRDNILRTLTSAAHVGGVEQFQFDNNQVSLEPGGGCRDGDTAVVIQHCHTVSIQGNDLGGTYARVVPETLVAVSEMQICGNRIAGMGSTFDQPTACA